MKKQITLLLLIAATLVGCSKKEDPKPIYTIDQTTVSLNYDKEHQYVVKDGATGIAATSIAWTSSDETVGTINASGLFKAKKIGKTTIKAEGNGISLTSEVTITPYSTLCKEPFTDFNATIQATKAKETRSLLLETSTGLTYLGENSKIRNVMYIFENGVMSGSILMLANTTSVVEESTKFFRERYTYIGTDSDVFFFSDKTVIVGLKADASLGFIAIYIKNNTGVSAKSNIQAIQKLFSERKNNIQLNSFK